ncbi:hypothetical protein [Micromonospora chersina]
MTQPAPRQQIRDLIAERITAKLDEWGVGEPFPEDQLADAVMELFPEAARIVEGRYRGVIPTARYVLHTASEPIQEPA